MAATNWSKWGWKRLHEIQPLFVLIMSLSRHKAMLTQPIPEVSCFMDVRLWLRLICKDYGKMTWLWTLSMIFYWIMIVPMITREEMWNLTCPKPVSHLDEKFQAMALHLFLHRSKTRQVYNGPRVATLIAAMKIISVKSDFQKIIIKKRLYKSNKNSLIPTYFWI